MNERKIKTLQNGLQVVFTPFPSINSVNLRLFGRAGSEIETINQLGHAHFLEHVVFEGTEKYQTAETLSKVISDYGGYHNGGTGFYNVGYIAKLLKDDFERGYDFLSQILLHPLLREKDVLKHRNIISQEAQNELDDPIGRFFINSTIVNYPKTERHHYPIIGTLETINSTTQNDLKTFFDVNYSAENFVLGVCGDLDERQVFDLAEKYFSGMKTGKKNTAKDPESFSEFKMYTENNNQLQQATIQLEYPAAKVYSEKFYSTVFLNNILGRGDISRLFTEIRQKRGLAYSAGSYYSKNKHLGELNIIAQIDEKNYAEVLKIFIDEIQKIIDNEVTDEEFIRTQKAIKASFVFDNEKPSNRADFYTSLVLDENFDLDYNKLLENFQNVTKKDIKERAKEIFTNNPKLKILSNKLNETNILSTWEQLKKTNNNRL